MHEATAIESSTGVAPQESVRQCGRCRQFIADATNPDPVEISRWWLCPPCRKTLLPIDAHRGVKGGTP